MRPSSPALALVVGSVLLAGACTTGTTPPRWETLTLPGGLTPVTLASTGDAVLVGAFGPERPRPRLLRARDGSFTEVPLTPRSLDAFEARWFQVATRSGAVEAVGGARGGAHANYRWSTWSGDTDAVVELEQPFGVFGSYGAGDLAGVAYAGGSPVILGAWQSEQTGLDIALWTKRGERWSRQSSTGTALGSTPQSLVSAGAIASNSNGLILSGSVTSLAPGSVRVNAAVWTAPHVDGPWTRVDLPRPEGDVLTEAHAATCASSRCLVTGREGSRLAVWEVVDGSARRVGGIPGVVMPENATAPAPLRFGAVDVLVPPTERGSAILRHDTQGWSRTEGPSGRPVSAVVVGDELWVVTTDARGTGTLWVARVA